MKALITGVTGQDGSYLAELLLSKGYEVHGTVRRSSTINTGRIDHLISDHSESGFFNLHYADLLDPSSLSSLISKIMPDEVYNLAAQSHVAVSFQNPILTTQVGTLGSISILEAIRFADKEIKFYQASSSEMYGGAEEIFLNEQTKFDPKVHTQHQKFLHMKLVKFIENLIQYSQQMEFFLIMNHHVGVKPCYP